jgi:two-component system, LytTR family, sensor kinase
MFSHKYKFIFPGLLALYSFLNIIILEGDRLFQADLPSDSLFYIIFILCYLVWFSNWGIEKFIIGKFKKIHPLIIQFLISSIAVLLVSLISVYLTGYFLGEPFTYSLPNFLLTSGFTSRINLFLNCINAIYFFNKKFREKALEAEKLHSLNVEAKLESLHAQMNPHFFFNNLSALSVLIHEDVKLADAYLQKLSNIYRYVLNNKDQELVVLSDEIDFLNNYIGLLSIRFQDALIFKIDINKRSLNYFIPPAVLQLLVENVVKHNYFTSSEPIEVIIESDEDFISIRNKKQLKDSVEFSSGIGLQNISDRYKFLGKEILLTDDMDIFMVQLPLIRSYESNNSRGRALSAAKN